MISAGTQISEILSIERPGLGIIYSVIKENVLEKEEKISSIREKMLNEIKEYKKTIERLDAFETRHEKELLEIFPDYSISGFPFLMWPRNDLNNMIESHFLHLKEPENFYGEFHELKNIPEGFSTLISYKDFEETTKLTQRIIKDLIEELLRRKLIERKHIMGGFIYKIC